MPIPRIDDKLMFQSPSIRGSLLFPQENTCILYQFWLKIKGQISQIAQPPGMGANLRRCASRLTRHLHSSWRSSSPGKGPGWLVAQGPFAIRDNSVPPGGQPGFWRAKRQ